MDKKTVRSHELGNRLLVTAGILTVYLLGRALPLYGVVTNWSSQASQDASALFRTMLSADRHQQTWMALGITPYINASMIMMFLSVFRRAESRAKTSQLKMTRRVERMAFFIAVLMSFTISQSLTFQSDVLEVKHLRYLAMVEMVFGSMLITKLALWNKKHGIGDMTPIILVNLIVGNSQMIRSYDWGKYKPILLLCAVVLVWTLIAETHTLKIPVLRVSINNIHGDKSYIPIKWNPIGTMPVMFASALFLLPQLILKGLAYLFPENPAFLEICKSLVLTDPIGIGVYLFFVILIDVGFSFIMLMPKEQAKNLQKNGDCIADVYAGPATQRYLCGRVFLLSLLSGIFQAGVLCISLLMAYFGILPSGLALVPSNVMLLVGFICPLVREFRAYYLFDHYHFFM